MLEIMIGDVMAKLAEIPDASIQCCVTSPPYWGLRDYSCEGQIGLEKTPEEFVAKMVAVFREVRRVLRDDGVCWVNLGDSYGSRTDGSHGGWNGDYGEKTGQQNRYANEGIGYKPQSGLKPKDLCGIPWRVAFALQADGWWLRSDIIWAKPNPMPESVTDRPTKAHEYVFLLTKSERYYYDNDAIREPYVPHSLSKQHTGPRIGIHKPEWSDKRDPDTDAIPQNPLGRNIRSVWELATQPYSEAHFATFPEELPKRCILAGSRPGDTILDPFGGSGTTGKVALELGRRAILIELNPAYAEMIDRRCKTNLGLFF